MGDLMIEWDVIRQVKAVEGLIVKMAPPSPDGQNLRPATLEDLKRACEAVGLRAVECGVFDAIVAKGEENRVRAEKAGGELAEVVGLIGGDTAIEGAVAACRSLNEAVDQKRLLARDLATRTGEALGYQRANVDMHETIATLRAQLAVESATAVNIVDFAAHRIDSDIKDAASAWRAICGVWEDRSETLAKTKDALAELSAEHKAMVAASLRELEVLRGQLAAAKADAGNTTSQAPTSARRRRGCPMGERIVGYVISHTGKPGGPWESNRGIGVPAEARADRWATTRNRAYRWLGPVQQKHPHAKVFRLVRRERHRAEEAAVVEAALRYDTLRLQFERHFLTRTDGGPTYGDLTYADNYARNACAALRAKRGG